MRAINIPVLMKTMAADAFAITEAEFSFRKIITSET